MKILEFDVLLATPTEEDPDATTEHRIRILHGDQLRAELEAPKHGLRDMEAVPMHFTTLWAWCALARTKVVTDGFQAFKPRLLALEKVKKEVAGDVDPTQTEGATG